MALKPLDIVQSIKLNNNNHARTNCPFCGGPNTFSVSKIDGLLLWHCYRASCGTKGKASVGRSIDDLRLRRKSEHTATIFTLPDHFVNVLSNEAAVSYLKRNNCLAAYSRRTADIRYDPKLHRCVFVNRNGADIVGAVGRALNKDDKPKWWRYDRSSFPFIVYTNSKFEYSDLASTLKATNRNLQPASDTAVLVEDAASACAVSAAGVAGVALMGTNLADAMLTPLRQFSKVLVALDPDAIRKALDIAAKLRYIVDTEVVRIPDDLKYYNPEQIRSILKL
jgi:DNA primase